MPKTLLVAVGSALCGFFASYAAIHTISVPLYAYPAIRHAAKSKRKRPQLPPIPWLTGLTPLLRQSNVGRMGPKITFSKSDFRYAVLITTGKCIQGPYKRKRNVYLLRWFTG